MKRIILASTAALILGAPLAFAANSNMNGGELTTQHCSYLETQYKGAAPSEKALSLCRQDRHKNDVSRIGSKAGEARNRAARN